MKNKDNLKAAFAGESQANRKYLAFARKAEQEGYHTMLLASAGPTPHPLFTLAEGGVRTWERIGSQPAAST